MVGQNAERMLKLLLEETQHALAVQDPIGRVQIIGELVQRYAGWALYWAVDDAHKAGNSWVSIGAAIGEERSTVMRQHRARGPMFAVRPFHAAGSRNDDGQDALRQASRRLVHEMFPTKVLQASLTGRQLHLPVQALAESMTSTDARLLLANVANILEIEAELTQRHGYPKAASFDQERAVWAALSELRMAYERDKILIEVADTARLDHES